MMKLKKFIQT